MTLNCKKLRGAINFMKYLARVVSLIFLVKTLIWDEITSPASNLLNFAELVVNESLKSVCKKIYEYSYLYSIHHCLMQKFQELITNELDNFTKILISKVFD